MSDKYVKVTESEIFENPRCTSERDERQNQSPVSDKRNIRRISSRGIAEKETEDGASEISPALQYRTIHNCQRDGRIYRRVHTKAFSFDGNPAEISSNVNMYVRLTRSTPFLKYYTPPLNVYADLLTSKSNIFIEKPLLLRRIHC